MQRSRFSAFGVRRWVLGMAVLASMACVGTAHAQVGGYGVVETVGQGKDAIKKITVGGTRYQMGYWYGRLLAADVAGCVDSILDYADQPRQAFEQAVSAMWNPVFFDTEAYDHELQGIHDGCVDAGYPEVTVERLRWAQLVPDMSELGCSLFSAWGNATVDGDLYQLRQLDWAMDAGVQDYPVVAIFEPIDGHRHAIIGFAGSLGISGGGLNEHGIAQSQIMGAFNDYEALIGTPFPILLRECLYHDATMADAITRMRESQRTNNYYYCISGPEGDGMEGRLLLTSLSRFDEYADNESVDPHPKYEDVFHTSFDDVVYWTRHNGDRNDELYAAINENYGTIDKDASIAIAQACADNGGGTLLTVIYNATQREFWVAYADGSSNPAQNEPFMHFTLGGPEEETALEKYVRAPDPTYDYELVDSWEGSIDPYGRYGYTVYVIELTSQTWRSPADVDPSVWKHWLTILVPDTVSFDKALLLINGGSNNNEAPTEVDEQVLLMAMSTQSVVAMLSQVPNQPTKFAYEGFSQGHSEDGIIARTFRRYAEEEFGVAEEPTWPLLLPMVKSAVRAMDTIQDFVGSGSRPEPVDIEGFVVTGASKRGWTTWLTGSVDNRVRAIAPLVIDLLNMDEHMAHHFDVYGYWAEAIGDYESQGIMPELNTDMGQALLGIVDPHTYFNRPLLRSIPKYIVNGSGDQFFIPDSTQFYWDDLEGDKFLRFIPNAGHSLGTGGWNEDGATASDVVGGLLGFYYTILTEERSSNITWTLEGYDSIRVETDPDNPPIGVKLWQTTVQGTTPDDNPDDREYGVPPGTSRDFRIETIVMNDWWWTSTPLTSQGDGVYVGKVAIPQSGWTGFFVEVEYTPPTIPSMPPTIPGGPEIPEPRHKLSTQIRIVPESEETSELTVDINVPQWGSVSSAPLPIDPNSSYEYKLGTEVVLTPQPEYGCSFVGWQVYDPNHPGDANYAVFHDPAKPLELTMGTDWTVKVEFACPLSLVAYADPNVIWQGGSVNLIAEPSGGLPPYHYEWFDVPGAPDANQVEVTIPGDLGERTYTVRVEDAVGQRTEAQVKLNVVRPVSVSVSALHEIVPPNRGTVLTATPSGGVGPYGYRWTNESGEEVGDEPTLVLSRVAGSGTYTVACTDKLGQTATASKEVRVAGGLDVSITAAPEAISEGQDCVLTASATGGHAPNGYTYSWSTGETGPTITVSPIATQSYTVTAFDGLGQQAVESVRVTVGSLFDLDVMVEPNEGGGVAYDPGPHAPNSMVALRATPNEGWVFAFWGGNLSNEVNRMAREVSVTMNSDKDITALFVPLADDQTGVPSTVPEQPLPTPEGCGVGVGTAQLGAFWAACLLGLGGLSSLRRTRRYRS